MGKMAGINQQRLICMSKVIPQLIIKDSHEVLDCLQFPSSSLCSRNCVHLQLFLLLLLLLLPSSEIVFIHSLLR